MANPDRPNGFTPVGTLSGAPWQGLVQRVGMTDTSGTMTGNYGDLYVGDPITIASGLATPSITDDADIAGVVVAIGKVVAGQNFEDAGPFDPTNLEQQYADGDLSDTEEYVIYYAPALDTVFEVQATNTVLTLLVGGTANISIAANTTAHGSRTTSNSTVEISVGSDDVRVVRLAEFPDNDTSLGNARYHVVFIDPANGAVR